MTCHYGRVMAWQTYENVAPRKAGAGIILRGADASEVLMAQRNKRVFFMGGHHVFPGGAVERGDSAGHVEGAENPERAQEIFAVAREVFEETGLLLVRQAPSDLEALRLARQNVLAGALPFADLLDRLGLRIRAEEFIPAGRWITPAFSPKRFDTQYYIYRYAGPRYEEVLEPEGEIVALRWLNPAEARRLWHRGAIRLSTPVAFVLRQLAAVPMPDVIPRLERTPGVDDRLSNRFEPQCGVNIIPLPTETLPPATHTNCVILGEEELYVIDPGAANTEAQGRLRDHVNLLLALGTRVAAVLLSHGHRDHVGAADVLRRTYGAEVWAHDATRKCLPFPLDRALADGEILDIPGDPPWRLRCLHTPGHDPGHLAFLEESTRTLFCGDLIANPGTIMIALDAGGDMTQYLESLERLLEEDFIFTVPAHGLPAWGRRGKDMIRELIAHRLEREGKIKATLDAGATTQQALLEGAYDDTPREAWPLAAQQLRAHLKRLGVSGVSGP